MISIVIVITILLLLFIFDTYTSAVNTIQAVKVASAYTITGLCLKAYISQEEARLNREKLEIGEVIYFPDGTKITVEEGLKEIESEGFWYAWTTIV